MQYRYFEAPLTQTFIAETELDGGKLSALQCLLFWIEVERYRCCTSQWQPGSGFPEAYAAWIQGKYVSTGLIGIDVGDIDLDTDLVRRVRFGDHLRTHGVGLAQVGAFDRAQHVVFQHLERIPKSKPKPKPHTLTLPRPQGLSS